MRQQPRENSKFGKASMSECSCLNEAPKNWQFMLIYSKLLLKHGADPTRKNRDGNTALDLVKEGDQDVADLLRGDIALLEAAKRGDLDKVEKLLTLKNVNCRDTQGRNSTPLHLAAGYNHLEVQLGFFSIHSHLMIKTTIIAGGRIFGQ